MANNSIPNGSAEAPLELPSIPPIVGINFGNSYASIAVFTKEGLAECIANEDGERQIACAVSFYGEEMYIGNQAKHQLVKNAHNTITGFRNLIGKRFSEISQKTSTASAPVIQHPTLPDEPAYKVQVLIAAPSPLPPSTATNTPAASIAPTPRSEPILSERILTVSEVTTIFLKSLVQSAQDFLGKQIHGAVISVPSWFTDTQKNALEKAATEAGVAVLQLLEEAGAAAAATTTDIWNSKHLPDRTQLLVDLGASSLSLALLSIREGLSHILASSSSTLVGGDQLDDILIRFFAADFTKRTKTPLTVCPATDNLDKRAEAKLRLAVEHTKRTISASPGAATCSVESLKEGLDYTGTVNRMRFDMLAKPIYTAVANAVLELLKTAGVDPYHVDEIVYVGGSTCLPGLDEHIGLVVGFPESIQTPFSLGTVVGGGVGDPTTILARGCAVQAALLASLPDDEDHAALREGFGRNTDLTQVKVTSRTLGLIFPGFDADPDNPVGGTWVPVVLKETALPARRTVRLDVGLSEESKKFAFEIWEVTEDIRIKKEKPPKLDYPDSEAEDEEELEIKHKVVNKQALLGSMALEAKLGLRIKGKSKEAGLWQTCIEVGFIVDEDRALEVNVKEVGKDGVTGNLKLSG